MNYYKLKVLKDNYIWVLVRNNSAIAIDCSCADTLLDFIKTNSLNLDYILITHAHPDHIYGLEKTIKHTSAKIICGLHTKQLINNVAREVVVVKGEFKINNFIIKVIPSPGHTEDHICYYFIQNKWLFSGDTLFSLGCGRAFFNIEQLYTSLNNIIQVCDVRTLIFPGHNYIDSNLRFLNSIDYFKFRPKYPTFINELQIPTTLSFELQYNPFLNIHNNNFKQFLLKKDLNDFEFFSYLRNLKDNFN